MKQIVALLILICGIFLTEEISAQTFQVTDIQFASNVPEYNQNKTRTNCLGQLITLHEYDSYIVIEAADGDKAIFNKKNDTTFIFTKGLRTVTLTIEKFMGYYRAIRIRTDEHGVYYSTWICKRK